MKRPDIEKLLPAVLNARTKNPKNPIMKDFEEVLLYVRSLEDRIDQFTSDQPNI